MIGVMVLVVMVGGGRECRCGNDGRSLVVVVMVVISGGGDGHKLQQ